MDHTQRLGKEPKLFGISYEAFWGLAACLASGVTYSSIFRSHLFQEAFPDLTSAQTYFDLSP
jgi:hypothetical protein